VNTELKTIVNPRVNFSTLVEPNCAMLEGANKTCLRLRQTMEDTMGDNFRMYNRLDIIVISFEGVLGAFSQAVPQKPLQPDQVATDTLLFRPGIATALEELLKNFKVVILTSDQSSLHQNAIIKALNKSQVPFDAIYKTVSVGNDNFFTYEKIQLDLDSTKV